MTNFVCTITYGSAGTPATYVFAPAITASDVHPNDTMQFVFQAGTGAPAISTVNKAVLIAGWKEHTSNPDSSPFANSQNDVDLLTESTLTIGNEMGKWGFVVTLAVVDTSGMTHFYYLPDPEVVVTPR